MNGTDLSPLLDGKQPREKRSYRTAAYSTTPWRPATTSWLLISDNSRPATSGSTRCTTRAAT